MLKFRPKELIEIESLIRSRINLPTNKKKLETFGLNPIDLVVAKHKVASQYKTFDANKRNKFISLIGGPVNFNEVKSYIEALE